MDWRYLIFWFSIQQIFEQNSKLFFFENRTQSCRHSTSCSCVNSWPSTTSTSHQPLLQRHNNIRRSQSSSRSRAATRTHSATYTSACHASSSPCRWQTPTPTATAHLSSISRNGNANLPPSSSAGRASGTTFACRWRPKRPNSNKQHRLKAANNCPLRRRHRRHTSSNKSNKLWDLWYDGTAMWFH